MYHFLKKMSINLASFFLLYFSLSNNKFVIEIFYRFEISTQKCTIGNCYFNNFIQNKIKKQNKQIKFIKNKTRK